MFYHPTGGRTDKIVFAVVILAALGIASFGAYTAYRGTLALRWPAVPCTIIASVVEQPGGERPYRFHVMYQYTWQGRVLLGHVYQKENAGTTDVAEADQLVREYPVGVNRTCFVNPGDPAEAILRHDDIRLPLVVTAFALLGVWFFASLLWGGERAAAVPGVLFVGLIGAATFVGFFALPLWTWARSLNWVPTPCEVRSADIRFCERHGEISYTVYWPDIVFVYRLGGVTYRANTYNPSFLGSPWYYGSRGVVRRHPPGRVTTCYVDPLDPSRAILDRSFSSTQWFGLWPLIMTAIAIGGFAEIATGRKLRVGTPWFWGSLALAVGSAMAILVLLDTASDLLEDRRAGVAEIKEAILVGLVVLITVVLLAGWAIGGNRLRRSRGLASPLG